jgi:atypical dual specificity phosphatase
MDEVSENKRNVRDRWYAHTVYWPTLAWNFLLGRVLRVRRWWDEIVPGLYLGARPLPGDPLRLQQLGIRAIVNTCEEFPGYTQQYQSLQIEQFWMPTVDFTHPRFNDVLAAIEFIDRHLREGRPVYVHCKAGRARSATVLLCYLIAKRAMEPQAAMELILRQRPHINPKLLQRPVVQHVIGRVG